MRVVNVHVRLIEGLAGDGDVDGRSRERRAFLEQEEQEGRLLLMLDGLDEVPLGERDEVRHLVKRLAQQRLQSAIC